MYTFFAVDSSVRFEPFRGVDKKADREHVKQRRLSVAGMSKLTKLADLLAQTELEHLKGTLEAELVTLGALVAEHERGRLQLLAYLKRKGEETVDRWACHVHRRPASVSQPRSS